MVTRALFALLSMAFPIAVLVKIAAQRRVLGRSPVILGAASASAWVRWFERVGPLALLAWPASWLWVAAGGAPLRGGAFGALGVVLMATGATFSIASIFLMGRAWRIGIDPENRTELAERGPYRWVRHPIYSGWLLVVLGNVLVVPHVAIGGLALLTAVGVAYQAHREEQHMLRTFGDRYARYTARTGAFAPRLRPTR